MAAPTTQSPPTLESYRGIVKQVLSGDAVIVRGQPVGGPPPERQINFSNVSAPRLARKGTNNVQESQDEPYAWESREFLRKKVVGKEVVFTIDPKSKQLNREYGCIYIGKDIATGENITELMVAEGWLSVRRESIRGESNLLQLEDAAKSQCKGKWAGNDEEHRRSVKWTVENPRALVDKLGGKEVPAIIEHVRDGSTVRAFLLNDFTQVTLMISGIRCPSVKLDGSRAEPNTPEALGEQAKYFVEARLLQRDIKVVLETANNNNVVGSIIHPSGNIAELLLREGFAKCVDWSMTTVSCGPEKLRAAERHAKQNKMKIWKDYKAPVSKVADKDKEFTAKVIEIVNGDALVVLKNDGTQKKVFLASIRPPRLDDKDGKPQGKVFRPLFDIPHLFEAREFLRKMLIAKKVSVTVDYVQPAQNNFPEKTCCTVRFNDVNVAEAMVAKGLATVVRYRQDDDQRAACYDDLLAAEAKAIKGIKGLHNKKDNPLHRINDVTDPNKAKPYLSFLKRAGRVDAVPEFVASGSRMRAYVPRETCLLTFLLAGITCPRAARVAPGGGGNIEGEPYGAEALAFTKSLVLQREVQIEVESMDKGGNFIGWLFIDDKNVSVELVSRGFSSVHGTAESSLYYHSLISAQNSAKQQKIGIWKDFKAVEVKKIVEEEVVVDRKVNYKPMVVTEITSEGRMYGQNVSDGASLEKISEALQKAFQQNPPLSGAYQPRKNDICAAKFIDNLWYRAKVEKSSGGKVHVFYLDYGNREITLPTKCAQLPQGLNQSPFYAREMSLALIKLHKEEDYVAGALDALRVETEGEVLVNVEYSASGVEYVTMQHKADNTDIGKKLLQQGHLLVEFRRDRRFKSLLTEYQTAQEEAKKNHLNIWQYGDVTDDDAHEFGMER